MSYEDHSKPATLRAFAGIQLALTPCLMAYLGKKAEFYTNSSKIHAALIGITTIVNLILVAGVLIAFAFQGKEPKNKTLTRVWLGWIGIYTIYLILSIMSVLFMDNYGYLGWVQPVLTVNAIYLIFQFGSLYAAYSYYENLKEFKENQAKSKSETNTNDNPSAPTETNV